MRSIYTRRHFRLLFGIACIILGFVLILINFSQCKSRSLHNSTSLLTFNGPLNAIQILVDGKAYWMALEKDIRSSTEHIYIQSMSFEGDTIGKTLSKLLMSCANKDIRILIDTYSKYVISDKFIYAIKNRSNKKLQDEFHETKRLIDQLQNSGIKVKYTNPMDPFLLRYPARNHKKLVLIDDRIAYIGGINICDHNFEWHDIMLRIESANIVKLLEEDFLATWESRNTSGHFNFGSVELIFLDGHSNEILFMDIMKRIGNAEESIHIMSAYLTFPFFNKLREVRQRGVNVVFITPEINNKGFLKDYIIWESVRSGIDLRFYLGRMSHVKAILIDDKTLILGTANFDYTSYALQQEIIIIITDRHVISNFQKHVLEPDMMNSIIFYNGKYNRINGFFLNLALKCGGRFFSFINKII